MASKPWMKFFPGDWSRDAELRRCSAAARGVWLDLLCLMWECEERGRLATAGRPWEIIEAAHALPGDPSENRRCIEELVRNGVASVDGSGALYSRRMMRDEEISRARVASGAKGGSARKGEENPQIPPIAQITCKQNASKTQANAEQNGKHNASKLEAKDSLSHARACALTSDVSSSRGDLKEEGGAGGENKKDSRGAAENAESFGEEQISYAELTRRRERFGEFWSAWPFKQGGKLAPAQAWNSEVLTTDPEVILAGYRLQLPGLVAQAARDPTYVVRAQRWLLERRWEDETAGEARRRARAGMAAAAEERGKCAAGCGAVLTAENFGGSNDGIGYCAECWEIGGG